MASLRMQVSAVQLEVGGRSLLALVTGNRIAVEGDASPSWPCEPPAATTSAQLLARLRAAAEDGKMPP